MSSSPSRSLAAQGHPDHDELLAYLVLDNAPTSVPLARQFARLALAARGYQAHTGTLELVTSELVTNSVVHAQPSCDAPISVRLLVQGAVLRLEVNDGKRRRPMPRTARPDQESGRGLRIVEALTMSWGSYLTNHGKCVWCEVDTKCRAERRSR
ncbi:ATP-binding protein [Streptantibioticus ferralitis]|uniref:ATP-binding protein n=1 Tax=Streptantibioticus ferralitis TaxID=236510 RepID=A0ABT5Z0A8_9ACTN|nr:ATP-binding protein [Streptantibioticus ferralitis]MDF2257139.1 ATP-binding protein [Streptantibioticus ferralitis]